MESFRQILTASNRFIAIIALSGFSAITLIPAIADAAPPNGHQPDISGIPSPDLPHFKDTGESFAKGRILVVPRAGLPVAEFSRILKQQGGGKVKKVGQSDLHIVDVPVHAEESIVASLSDHPHLKLAELDRRVPPSMTPNDPYYGSEWHLPKISAQNAWNTTQGSGITIAILDSGVNGAHPDLSAQMVPGWNFYDNNSDTSDVFGHGTLVAGTASAITNNGTGVSSVAGQSKIMPIRITDTSGYGYASTIAQGLVWASDNGVRVANVSFGGAVGILSVQNAAQYMKDKGGLVIAAAGNTGTELTTTPTTTMIPVSATDANDAIASWSSYGNYVAMSAPGVSIWTTRREGDYKTASGTSLSSPLTAGVVALMMSANSKLSSLEIESLLFSSAIDLGAAGRDTYYGYGRIDAAAAVQASIGGATVQDTEAPSVLILNPLEGAVVNGLVPVDINAFDNVGVSRAELWVNGTNVATDSSSPFAFTWDSAGMQNGGATLTVLVFDAANNMGTSSINVTVDNPAQPIVQDTEPPVVTITNPVAGNVSGNVTISVNASDNSSTADIALAVYIDGVLKATGTGGTLSTTWNTRTKGLKAGTTHTIKATATDAAGNMSAASVNVTIAK
jgi:thermitase